jgi:hypothetical protein
MNELTIEDLKRLREGIDGIRWYEAPDEFNDAIPDIFELAEEALKAREMKKAELARMMKTIGYQEDYDDEIEPVNEMLNSFAHRFKMDEEGE